MTIRVNIRELMRRKFGEDEVTWPTRTQMAMDLQVTQQTVRSWMEGFVTGTDFDTLEKWCRYFGVEPGEILILE